MRLAILLVILSTVFTAFGKEKVAADTITARKAFVRIPVSRLDLLDPPLRLDMLDYWDADSIAHVKNNMEGRSWLEKVAPDYLLVRLTEVTNYQIKILPSKKYGSIVATAYTIDGENGADDTSLFFYDSEMNPLPRKKFLKLPEVKDFFSTPKGSQIRMADIEEAVDFPTIEFKFSPDNNTLRARLTVGEYMDRETFETIRPYMTDELIYIWDGSSFRKSGK